MADSWRPSKIPVVPAQNTETLRGRKSYKDLLQQGKNRGQDGRGAVYSEYDHRNLSHAGGTTSASIPSDGAENGRIKDLPVPSTGSSGLISSEKGVLILHSLGKSGPR